MSRLACCLLVVLAVVSPAGVTATATDGTATTTTTIDNTAATATATGDRTAVASDDTFGGFTLGAAILAVVVAGSYRYLRG